MSELIQKNDNRATIRWKLLTGASALALTAYVSSAVLAKAEDANRPQVWIEFGGLLDRVGGGEEQFVPPFILATPRPAPETISPLSALHTLRYAFDEEARLSFQPKATDWVFSASVRYGRSQGARHDHQQSYPGPAHGLVTDGLPRYAAQLVDAKARTSENHAVLDFAAGRDVGLGRFGRSVVSAGVRFAQFSSHTNRSFNSDPDWHFSYGYTFGKAIIFQAFHSNIAHFSASRKFHGVGPSISWEASAPIAGNSNDGSMISLDWGVNAALLFGRQRAATHHQSSDIYDRHLGGLAPKYLSSQHVTHVHAPVSASREKSVTVPNVGGFAGISWRYDDAKISFGYKADFFFNAIDGGIDARKNENLTFNGPYASISIGLGD